jgi:hypothetical protein
VPESTQVEAGFSGRYWSTIFLLVLQQMFEYFDFFVISYVAAVVAPIWHLTFGQSGLILLGAGLGAIHSVPKKPPPITGGGPKVTIARYCVSTVPVK